MTASSLIGALKHEGLEITPGEKLPDDVVADFVAWVQDGVADPREGAALPSTAIDIEKERRFWSFVAPAAHSRPAVQDADWPRREHDWFVRATHEPQGVKPVREATREEWLRRVTFDLTGLPPSPEELDAFLADPSAEALAAVVDRLLDDTRVVWEGEFGRPPTTEGTSGRDHNHHGFSIWLAGGGVRGGMVHGATDEFGLEAIDKRVHVHDLHATMLHLMGLDHEKLIYHSSGRDYRLTAVHGHVVKEIMA